MAERRFGKDKATVEVLTVEAARAHAGDDYDGYTEIDCVRQLDGAKGTGASRQYKIYGRSESVDLSDKHVALFNSMGAYKGAGLATDPKFWEAIRESDLRSTQVGEFVDEVTALTVVISDSPFPGEEAPEAGEEATEEEAEG